MIEMLKKRTQPTTIYKVKTHTNINGNEQADQLAKNGAKKQYRFGTKSYEFAHTTPFFSKKTHGPDQIRDPTKALSDASKHTSLNTTAKPTLK